MEGIRRLLRLLIIFILAAISTFILIFLFSIPCMGESKDKDKAKVYCPKTLIPEDCTSCHVLSGGKMRIRETSPDKHLTYPSGFMFLDYPDNPKGYYSVTGIDDSLATNIELSINYMKQHKVNKLVLDIHSYGGNVFSAWKTKGLLDEFESSGGIVETRLRGMALSAGFIVFCAGTKGHRYVSPQAELMLHEIGMYKGGLFYIEKVTPSSAEEEARILNHLQDTITSWLATRGKLSKDELRDRMKQREFWMNGREAYEMGFADMLIK